MIDILSQEDYLTHVIHLASQDSARPAPPFKQQSLVEQQQLQTEFELDLSETFEPTSVFKIGLNHTTALTTSAVEER